MTGRERVKRAIYFQDPDRVPYNFDANRTPEDGIEYGEDMMWVFCSTRGGMEEFGVVYETIDDSFGEPKVFPLKDAESLDNYTFPDFSEDWRYEEMREIIKKNNGEKYVLGMFPVGLFQHMIDVFSFEDFLVNCIANPELVEAVCDGFLKICMDTADKMAEAGVDGVIGIDDTALQDRLMVSMDIFRKIFKPRYVKLYDHCKSLGLDTFIHSCGYTIDIIEELIDAGLQVVNIDQQDNMGIRNISERYKGRVCFYCPLDIQRTLDLSKEEIEDRVREMIDCFSTEHGGYIAKTYPQPRAVKMTDEYLKIMTDAFKKYGVYNR